MVLKYTTKNARDAAQTDIYNELIAQAIANGDTEYAATTDKWDEDVLEANGDGDWELRPPPARIGNEIKMNTFIVIGASITEAATSGSELKDLIDSTYSAKVTVIEEASSGWTTTNLRNNIDSILAANPIPGAYVFIHIGGNNVSGTRPYSTTTQGERDTITDDITYILDAIETAGMIPLPASLTFRDYDNTTAATEENGSKPYNDSLINPLYYSRSPEWCYSSGKPWLQMYEVMFNDHATCLQGDNVHLTAAGSAAFRQHIVDTVCLKIFTDTDPTEIV